MDVAEMLKFILMAVGALVLGIIACFFLIQLVIHIMAALLEVLTGGMR